MKILIIEDKQFLRECGFHKDTEYDVRDQLAQTFIGSKWAVEVKAFVAAPENKALEIPENK